CHHSRRRSQPDSNKSSAGGFAMTIRQVLLHVVLAGCGSAFWGAMTFAEETPASRAASQPISGREIFLREWLPNDPRSHGGDGLGPVFNESSCVACHTQGGIGGAGAKSKKVVILSASSTLPDGERLPKFQAQFRKVSPDLAACRSAVFHRFGTE